MVLFVSLHHTFLKASGTMGSDLIVAIIHFIGFLRTEGCSGTNYSEFGRWQNGGGLFHKSANIDPTAIIETGAIVQAKSSIGPNVIIGSGAVIGPSVCIVDSTNIGFNAALSNCFVGESCIIHHGSCIGQDGFGFFVNEEGHVMKKPQMLRVKIGCNVEIGANTCIDRGSWRDTVVGDHTKIDNLVQIGHNAIIGKGCIICGQVGIAGSVTLGDFVTLGGRAMVRDHVSIASKVRIAANSGVTKDIVASGDYGGFPAVPIREWRRHAAYIRKFCKDGADETKTKAHESPYSSSSSVVSSSDATTGESKGKAVADEVSGKNLTKMRRFKGNLTDLRLKKRMFTGKSVQEDELEDTACSPVNNGPSFEEYGSRIS